MTCEIEETLAIGDMVLVDESADYSGQEMPWTEIMEPGILENGEVLYHYSDTLLFEFYPKVTCFFSGEYCPRGHCYIFKAPQKMECETDGREVRIELEQGMLLKYIGEVE